MFERPDDETKDRGREEATIGPAEAAPIDAKAIADLVFLGLNSRVIAIDRYTGEIAWDWKSPEGSGYVSILLDGDRLVAVVNGYAYCLDPVYGQEVWRNPLKGLGLGIASIASVNGATSADPAAARAQQQRQAGAAGAAATI